VKNQGSNQPQKRRSVESELYRDAMRKEEGDVARPGEERRHLKPKIRKGRRDRVERLMGERKGGSGRGQKKALATTLRI